VYTAAYYEHVIPVYVKVYSFKIKCYIKILSYLKVLDVDAVHDWPYFPEILGARGVVTTTVHAVETPRTNSGQPPGTPPCTPRQRPVSCLLDSIFGGSARGSGTPEKPPILPPFFPGFPTVKVDFTP
jgi:hypothetical protein